MDWLKVGLFLFLLVGLADMSIAAPHRAPEKPALGLKLGTMTLTDTAIWLARHDLNCHREHERMRCHQVRPSQIGLKGTTAIDELQVSFNPQGRLKSVEILRKKISAAEAGALLKQTQKNLKNKLGAPTRLVEGRLIEYRFDDYWARIATVRLSKGLAMSEFYSTNSVREMRPGGLARR